MGQWGRMGDGWGWQWSWWVEIKLYNNLEWQFISFILLSYRKYIAINRGSVHIAPLVGHTQSVKLHFLHFFKWKWLLLNLYLSIQVKSQNYEPAPGTTWWFQPTILWGINYTCSVLFCWIVQDILLYQYAQSILWLSFWNLIYSVLNKVKMNSFHNHKIDTIFSSCRL